ncbi:MAG: hypothetical protein E6772_02990 [Dysgonomonas sp.]|nr:hypothetical protein [Dysgonomonas sp.]
MRRKFLILSCGLLFAAGSMNAQVGIGTSTPDASAVLDITSTNKGVIFPRVTLTSRTDNTTIANPTTGLMVYNTGTHANFQIEGYLFWDGGAWRLFSSGQTISPEIATLGCGAAELKPSTYKIGEKYEGALYVPYTGGNGGSYSAGAPVTNAHGFTIQLQAGTLEYGNGNLVYTVSHPSPTIASPQTTQLPVNVPFAPTLNCTATVGTANADVQTRTYLGPMTATTSGTAGAEFVVSTMDNRYQLRFFIANNTSLELTDIQMRINPAWGVTNDNIIAMHTYTWSQILPSGAYDYADKSSAGQAWNNFALTTDWKLNGDPAVYNYGAPEYHQIIFTSTDLNIKRVYRYTFFFGAPNTSYSSYSQAKCWVHAEEIQAE